MKYLSLLILTTFLLGCSTGEKENDLDISEIIAPLKLKKESPKTVRLDANAADHYSSGKTKLASGDYSGAIADYTKAIGLDPKNAEAYYKRGEAKSHFNDNSGAILDVDKAILLNSNDANYYTLKGNAHISLRKYDLAIQDFDKAIELTPNDAYLYRRRGDAKFQKYSSNVECCRDWRIAGDMGDAESLKSIVRYCQF
jgi:tetratricopeptide (TPR) repeat protein